MNKNNDLKSKILLMRKKNFGEDELLNEEDLKDNVSEKVLPNKSKDNINITNQVMHEDTKINKVIEDKDLSSKANEKAFNLLANKFNESVEVILELNKRVEKLETLVRLQSMQDYRKEKPVNKNYNGIKFFIVLLAISSISYYLYKNNIETNFIKEILKDFSTIIKK